MPLKTAHKNVCHREEYIFFWGGNGTDGCCFRTFEKRKTWEWVGGGWEEEARGGARKSIYTGTQKIH